MCSIEPFASPVSRRKACVCAIALLAARSSVTAADALTHPNSRWYEAAESMRQIAISWGDQAYGAVLVTSGGLVAEGPSRVVKDSDPTLMPSARRFARRNACWAHLTCAARFCTPLLGRVGCARWPLPRPTSVACTLAHSCWTPVHRASSLTPLMPVDPSMHTVALRLASPAFARG